MTLNQRQRMHAAMVAAVAENGYEATRVADVVKLSGVSRSAFYKHFDDKLDCFLMTLDEIAAMTTAALAGTYDEQLPWDERLRSIASALLDLVLEQPAAAQMSLVEIYSAGPQAVQRLDVALASVEKMVTRALEESPERKGMPRDLVRAIIAGILKTTQTRLRRGEEAALVRELPQLLDWGLDYRAPREPLRRPRRQPDRGAAPVSDPVAPRERLVTAITDTIAARGYPDATIVEIAGSASASLSTFYANFENKQEALLAALERQRDHAQTAFATAYESESEWPAAIRAGTDALFGFLAAEPAGARIAIVDAFTAGADALEAGDAAIHSFVVFLEPGRELAPDQPEIVFEAIGNSVHAIAYSQLRQSRLVRLRELTPLAAFVQLAPFVGADRALAAANS